MTGLTRQRKKDKGQRKRYIVYWSETKLDIKSEPQRQKKERGNLL